MRFDEDLTADERVARWVLREFRQDGSGVHLRGCPAATVRHVEGSDGEYGCDTGCEYARLVADISCPHGESERYEYGEFGDRADLLERVAE